MENTQIIRTEYSDVMKKSYIDYALRSPRKPISRIWTRTL